MNSPIPSIDLAALLWFAFCFFGYNIYADRLRCKGERQSIISVMHQYRLRWMRQMLKRENRMADVSIVGNLLRSITFFASTSILVVAGLVSVLGYQERATAVLTSLPFAVETSPILWEIKIIILILVFTYAFFKYTWSLRTHNYSSIIIGAAPLPNENPETHEEYAQRAAKLAINAARHYNHGQRAYYYGLAVLCWFFHPAVFIFATALVVAISYRRDFRSNALAMLLGQK